MHIISWNMASKSKPSTSGGQPTRRLSDRILEESLEAINLFSVDSSPKPFSSTPFILHDSRCYTLIRGCPGGSVVRNLPASAGATGDLGSIPKLGRSPGGGNDNPFQYSCLETSMGIRAWQAIVHGLQRVRHNWASNTFTTCSFTLRPPRLSTYLTPEKLQAELFECFWCLPLLWWSYG